MKKEKLFEILVIVAIMAGAAYAAFSDAHNFPNRWFTRDDAYYYFKVAQNISEGLGSTFDGVNLANGYHPLWLLVNIPIFALARFDLVLPLRILLLLMGAIHAATAIFLYRLISRVLSEIAGIFVATFWAFSLYIHATVAQFGLETGITAFSIVLFLYVFEGMERKRRKKDLERKEIIKLALLGVLVIFSRLDTVFLILLFGLYLVFRATSMRYFLLSDILGIVFITFASFIFRVGMKEYYVYGEMALTMTLISIVVTLPLFYFLGLYRHSGNEPVLSLVKRIIFSVSVASAISAVLLLVLQLAGFVGSFPRSVLLIIWGIMLLWVALTRFGVRYLSVAREREKQAPLELFKEKWKNWLSEGITYFGIVGAALGLYMLFNKAVFGTTSPVSGQVKRWWGSLGGNVYGGAAKRKYTFFGLDTQAETDFNAWGLFSKFAIWLRDNLIKWIGYSDQDAAYWQLFSIIVMLILVILLLSRKRTIRASVHFGLLPLFVGSVVQVISYHATGYSAAKEWYWVSQLVFTLLLLALLLDILIRHLMTISPSAYTIAYFATVFLAIFWAKENYTHLAQLMPYDVEHDGHRYMEILAVVEENTKAGSLIGMTGGGNLGYFIEDRTIVNMDGLINSHEYFLLHKEGRGDEHFAAMGMDYVFVNPNLLMDMPYLGEYEERLGEPIANYRKKAVVKFYE
ncbi:MAG: hypothetical protein GY755_18040 [Chloroflexi bacterium]|nr:hypothetical protein [Chloroflexota bacterium]